MTLSMDIVTRKHAFPMRPSGMGWVVDGRWMLCLGSLGRRWNHGSGRASTPFLPPGCSCQTPPALASAHAVALAVRCMNRQRAGAHSRLAFLVLDPWITAGLQNLDHILPQTIVVTKRSAGSAGSRPSVARETSNQTKRMVDNAGSACRMPVGRPAGPCWAMPLFHQTDSGHPLIGPTHVDRTPSTAWISFPNLVSREALEAGLTSPSL